MKNFLFTILFLFVSLSGNLNAQVPCSPDSVAEINQFQDLYRLGNIFIGGQPGMEILNWLDSMGVTQVVNLRTTRENRQHKRRQFDEAEVVLSLGMDYRVVPVGGKKNGSHPDKLGEVSSVLDTGEKVLLHCKTGGRARYFLMAYLVREQECPEESAKNVVRRMGNYFPLDLFLGNEVNMKDDD